MFALKNFPIDGAPIKPSNVAAGSGAHVKARRGRSGRVIKISRLTRAAFFLTIFYYLVAPVLAPACATPLPCALVHA